MGVVTENIEEYSEARGGWRGHGSQWRRSKYEIYTIGPPNHSIELPQLHL